MKCPLCGLGSHYIVSLTQDAFQCQSCGVIWNTNDTQSLPIPNEYPAVWKEIIREMQERDGLGRERYGTPLQPFNGRNVWKDHQDELLDALVYHKQMQIEWEWLIGELVSIYHGVVVRKIMDDKAFDMVFEKMQEIGKRFHFEEKENDEQ